MSKETEPVLHQDKQFVKVNYAEKFLQHREFVKCECIDCDFNKSDLRNNDFVDCIFTRCNFSLATIDGSGFRDVTFAGCKLMGMNFTLCNKFMFSFSFQDCHLDFSTFYGMKLRKTMFTNCSLKEVDFSETDLTASVFKNCDMLGTTFSNTMLEKVDFRSAQNFTIDPGINKMKKAKFAAMNLSGLLYKYNLDIDYEG